MKEYRRLFSERKILMVSGPLAKGIRLSFLLLAALLAAGSAGAQAIIAPGITDPAIIAPARVAPGDPYLCWLKSKDPLLEASATLRDSAAKRLASADGFFMPSDGEGYLYGFLLAVPTKALPGPASLLISATASGGPGSSKAGRADEFRVDFLIEEKKFQREDIPLDKVNTDIRTQPDPAKTAESKAFAAVFEAGDPTALFAEGPMVKPLSIAWRETAGFADERRYLYHSGGSDSTLHGGIDLGAKEGSEVLACAAGRVVFAASRIVTGNTVVIEHLPGLFSIYMHLSAIATSEGAVVASGERIGSVGSTGLSTGPHLHWELRIGTASVNPYYWLSRPLLDKDAISGRIKPPAEGR